MLDEMIVVVVKFHGEIRWYCSEHELWVLDLNKLRADFIAKGYSVPDLDDSDRFGIHVVNESNAGLFLDMMKPFEISRDELSFRLAKRFGAAKSWWDVGDLFPVLFVNFDAKIVGAFYYEGLKMEKYIPDNWKGEFVDFANDYSEEVFPTSDKFWVKGNSDFLKILNERGASTQNKKN